MAYFGLLHKNPETSSQTILFHSKVTIRVTKREQFKYVNGGKLATIDMGTRVTDVPFYQKGKMMEKFSLPKQNWVN